MPAYPQRRGIDAPILTCEPESPENAQLIAARKSARRRRPVLLGGELQRLPAVVPLAEVASIEIRRLIACRDVRTRVRCRVVHPPASHVHAYLARATLDAKPLEWKERHL